MQGIAKAHAIKEQLRVFWTKETKAEASRFLFCWILEAWISGVEGLQRTARTLLRYRKWLLNYFDCQITNGKAEGINNKIKVLKRRGYGYSDMDYFKLLLYQLHEKQTALIG